MEVRIKFIEPNMVSTRFEGPDRPPICHEEWNVGDSIIASRRAIEHLTKEVQEKQKALQDQNTHNELLQAEIDFIHAQALQAAYF